MGHWPCQVFPNPYWLLKQPGIRTSFGSVEVEVLKNPQITALVQGVPKNALSECCWSHNALAQSSFAGTPFGTPCIQQGADWRGAFKTCYTWEPATSSSGWQERASLKTARAFGVGSDSGQLLFVKEQFFQRGFLMCLLR